VLRRNETANIVRSQSIFTSGDLQINFGTKQVTMAGNEVRLTPTEYNLLQELVLNAGKVLAHDSLLRRIWGPEYGQEREYLHVFIGRLRSKLEPDPAKPKYIITITGIGYRFERIK